MAYGVISTTLLTSIGVPFVVSSSSVHFSEIFTTLASGISHYKFGNIDKFLFKELVISGTIGGIIGAYILSSLPGEKIKPYVTIYLILMGLIILVKGFKKIEPKIITTKIKLLGLIGGFFDAIGGGGWGPIVTSTLIARGNCPQKTIGSVNAAEFYITIAQSTIFVITIGLGFWKIILGLIIGGTIAAPLGAYLCKKITAKYLLFLVGFLIILINLINLLRYI